MKDTSLFCAGTYGLLNKYQESHRDVLNFTSKCFPYLKIVHSLDNISKNKCLCLYHSFCITAMEMVGPSKRLYAGVVCQFFFTTGYILTAAFAYFIKDWRILQAALSAPGILFLCYWWYVQTHTGCNRRNGPEFRRVFLRSNYTDITQNTYIQI